MGIAILIYASIEYIKQDAVKSNDNIPLQNPPTITRPKPLQKISSVTFAEVDTLYDKIDYTGCTTDLQKEERHKQFERMVESNYIGKLVQWTGKVADVDTTIFVNELYVKFKHTERSFISDVTVYFQDSERRNLLKLQKGDWVTYQGRIKVIAGLIVNHELVDGKIIRVQRN